MSLFSGTGVAVITPFTSTGEVDLAALKNVIKHLIQGKVEYLVILGTTGESATLSKKEKETVIETFFEVNEGHLPLVLGVGGNNTRAVASDVAYYSEKYPLTGILSVSPYYNKPSQEGIFQHYQAVASSTDLPVILYNVPGRTSSNLTAETTLRLAHGTDNIVAIKEASGDLEQGMAIIKDKPAGFQVLSGEDALTLPMIGAGFDGVISVTANAFPLSFSEMVRSALSEDMKQAQKIHYELLPFIGLNFVEGNPTGVKSLMGQMGLCNKTVRLPLVEATEELDKKMKSALSTTGN